MPGEERCPQPCGKTRFSTQAEAKLHCMVMATQGVLQIWYGSRECVTYHVTKSIEGRRGLLAQRVEEMRLLMGTRKEPRSGGEEEGLDPGTPQGVTRSEEEV